MISPSIGLFPKCVQLLELGEVEAKGLLQTLPHGSRGPSGWVIVCCFPKDINRELDWKYSTWDLNLHLYGMLALQEVALPTMSQTIPAFYTLSFKVG